MRKIAGLLAGIALLGGVAFATPVTVEAATPSVTTFAATPAHCKKEFFGIPTWYKYLELNNDCDVENFQVLGNGTNSGFLLVTLAIIDILLRVAVLVAVAFIIVGGFKYMTAQGEPAGIKAATQTLVGAIVGLIIAIFAVAIVGFIGGRIS